MTKFQYRRYQRDWLPLVLGILILVLTLLPISSQAQTPANKETEKAPIVLDGRILFEVGKLGNFTADKRADIINETLEREVRSPEPIKVEVIQENQQTVIRNYPTERQLLTVTEADVIAASSIQGQALIWRNIVENALKRGQSERTGAYVRQAWLKSIAVILVAIALHLALRFSEQLVYRRVTRFLNNPSSFVYPWRKPTQLFWQLVMLGLQIGIWIAVAYYVSEIFADARSWRYELFNLLDEQIFTLGKSSYSALDLLLLLAFTVGLWFAVKALTMFFRSYVLSRTGTEKGFQEVVATLTQYILTFLGLIVLWQIWGLDVGALAIIASVLGVGIGFGLQNITNNFISGLIITLERQIQVGDLIKLGNLVGTVKRIGARSTEIETLDQVSILVPNARFLDNEVTNWDHGDSVSRLRVPVQIAYGSNLRKVKTALLEAAKSHRDVLPTPRPQVWLQEFGNSSLNFDLFVWIKEPKKQFRIKSDLNYRIEERLRHYGLEVPFPQQDLHLRSPQLDHLINSLLVKNGFTSLDTENQPKSNLGDSEVDMMMDSLADLMSDEFLDSLEERLTATEIETLVTAMRSPEGLDIRDRRYRLNIYPLCFIGSEAVDWLVNHKNCPREEAIEIGQILLEQGIIHHVLDQHPFKDGLFFYRFDLDES